MSEILSRAWTVSHRVEIWLLILVAYLLQRNVNSGHMPTKAADPEAFMNVVSWGLSCLEETKGYVFYHLPLCSSCMLCYFYIVRCFMLEQYGGKHQNWKRAKLVVN